MTKTVHIVRAFTLDLGPDKQPIKFEPGIQQVPDEVADHWYVKANSAQASVGAADYAKSERQACDAQFVTIKEQMALYMEREKQVLEAEDSAGVEPTEPSFSRLGWPDTDTLTSQYEAAKKAYAEKPPAPPEGETAQVPPPPAKAAPEADPAPAKGDPKAETEGDPEKPKTGRSHHRE